MSDENTSMTFRLPSDLQAAFVARCKAADMTAAQVLRSLMREYLARDAQMSLPLSGASGKRKAK